MICGSLVCRFANAYFTLWYIAFVKASPLLRSSLSLETADSSLCMLVERCDADGRCSEVPS